MRHRLAMKLRCALLVPALLAASVAATPAMPAAPTVRNDADFSNASLYPVEPAAALDTRLSAFKAIDALVDTSVFRTIFNRLSALKALPSFDPLPAALLIPTNAAFADLLLTLAPDGVDTSNVALIEGAVKRVSDALKKENSPPQAIVDAVAGVVGYHVVAAGQNGSESDLKKAGKVTTATNATLDTTTFPAIKDSLAAASTRLGRSYETKDSVHLYLIDRVLLPVEPSALAPLKDIVFPADFEAPPTPAVELPDYPAVYLPYETPGFTYGVLRANYPPAPFFYGLQDYVSFLYSRADLQIMTSLVIYDKTLRDALPTLKDVHPVFPNDKAFENLFKSLNDDEVNTLVDDLSRVDGFKRETVNKIFERAVPLFEAAEGVPSLTEIVLYHILSGDKSLWDRTGDQETALANSTIEVRHVTAEEMAGIHGDGHEGHDHGDHDDHDHRSVRMADDDHDDHDHGDEADHDDDDHSAEADKEKEEDGDDDHADDDHDEDGHSDHDDHDGEHLMLFDKDDTRPPAHVDVTVPTGQGYASVIDEVLLPVSLPDGLAADAVAEASAEASEDDSTSANEEDGVCFPADAQVMGADGASVRMADLRAGHVVRSHPADTTGSPVFLFSHRDGAPRVQFVRVETASGHVVRATASHYLYVSGKLRAFGAVQKGDVVHTTDGDSRVVKVSRVVGRGLYAPHAMKSDLVVDGVLVSSYSTAVHPRWAEAVLAPVRMVARMGVTEPLGSALYNGADRLVGLLPKGNKVY